MTKREFNPCGLYVRKSKWNPASIWISGGPRRKAVFHVWGSAFWGATRKFGPNMGDIDFVARLTRNKIEYRQADVEGADAHHIQLLFKDGKLHVTEENSFGLHGQNVSFQGEYSRANKIREVLYRLNRLRQVPPDSENTDVQSVVEAHVEANKLTPTTPVPTSEKGSIGLGEVVALLSLLYACSIAAFNAGYFSNVNSEFVKLFSFSDLLGANISILQYFLAAASTVFAITTLIEMGMAFVPYLASVQSRGAKFVERLILKAHQNPALFWLCYIFLIWLLTFLYAITGALHTSSFALLIFPQLLFHGALLYFFAAGYKLGFTTRRTLITAALISLFFFSFDSGKAWYVSETQSEEGIQTLVAADGLCLERKIIRTSGNGLLLYSPHWRTFEYRNRDSIKSIFAGRGCL